MELEQRTGPELTGDCWGVARGVELPCPMVAIKSWEAGYYTFVSDGARCIYVVK